MTDFDDFHGQLQALYARDDYAAALDLATQFAHEFPSHEHIVYYWRITLSAQLNDFSQSLALLQEVLQTGFWYGETLLRKSPSLKSLQGIQEFENLVAFNRELAEQYAQQTYPIMTLRPQGACKSGGPACPLLLGLHANASTALASLPYWQPAASAGWLVAAPQSSQAMWKDAFTWDDRHIARDEILDHYASLKNQYAIDSQRTLLAGYDLGGEIAIWLALSQQIDAKSFLAINPNGPWMDHPEEWEQLLQARQMDELRGYFITSETDQSERFYKLQTFITRLNQVGISTALEFIPISEDGIHPDYDLSLKRALDYLVER